MLHPHKAPISILILIPVNTRHIGPPTSHIIEIATSAAATNAIAINAVAIDVVAVAWRDPTLLSLLSLSGIGCSVTTGSAGTRLICLAIRATRGVTLITPIRVVTPTILAITRIIPAATLPAAGRGLTSDSEAFSIRRLGSRMSMKRRRGLHTKMKHRRDRPWAYPAPITTPAMPNNDTGDTPDCVVEVSRRTSAVSVCRCSAWSAKTDLRPPAGHAGFVATRFSASSLPPIHLCPANIM